MVLNQLLLLCYNLVAADVTVVVVVTDVVWLLVTGRSCD